MIVTYAILDGFDLGVGIVHLYVGRTEVERRMLLRSVGPVWDGNEVWLIAGGGALFFAFPKMYALAFSGFYLPLIMVLWLLILRGISIEFRSHIESVVWHPFWDVAFAGASAMLAIFFGAALGNIVRGVPLGGSGYFFLPLFTDFTTGGQVGILDWFTILMGLSSLVALALHGALWVALKTPGELRENARGLADQLWWATLVMTVALLAVVPLVQPHLGERFPDVPWGVIFPVIAAAGLFAIRWFNRMGRARDAFLASCAYIAGMLFSVAFGLYPYVLPSNLNTAASLTIYNSSTTAYGLEVGLAWFIPGILLAIGYFIFVYRSFAGEVRLDEEGY